MANGLWSTVAKAAIAASAGDQPSTVRNRGQVMLTILFPPYIPASSYPFPIFVHCTCKPSQAPARLHDDLDGLIDISA